MSSQRRAELYIFLVTFVWGSTFVITKFVLENNSPLFFSSITFLLAAALLLPFFFRRLTRIPLSTVKKGTVLGLFLYVGFAAQIIGLQYTTASKSAFLTGLVVVLTPMVHYAAQHVFHLSRRVLRAGNLVGVAFAAVGLYLLTSPSGSTFNVGDGLTLICALMFAFYIVYLDFASSEPDKLQLTFMQFVVCGVGGLACTFLFENIKISFDAQMISSLLYLTIFATVIAMWVQNRYQQDTTPTRAAVIFAMEPVVAAICAYFVRNEILGVFGIIGGITILFGLLMSEFSEEVPLLDRVVVGGLSRDS